MLKAGGKAGIVIKNTFLSIPTMQQLALRRELLENCNLHTVLDLPGGTSRALEVKNSLIF